jgi:hypothetical protein
LQRVQLAPIDINAASMRHIAGARVKTFSFLRRDLR